MKKWFRKAVLSVHPDKVPFFHVFTLSCMASNENLVFNKHNRLNKVALLLSPRHSFVRKIPVISPGLYNFVSGFRSGVGGAFYYVSLYLPLSIKFAGTHLYTWVERDTVRVRRLVQGHNTMSPARDRTQDLSMRRRVH